MVLLFLINGLVCANADSVYLPKLQSALIIEGESSDVANTFKSIVINNDEVHFDVYRYPTIKDVGAGNGIQIDFLNLENYDYILVSVHQGTLSDNLLSRLSKYVLEGGRLYILYQSFPKPFFIESMELSSNEMLKLLRIDDEIKYENALFERNVRGSLLRISEEERLENSSRLGVNKIKKEQNHKVTPYKATMSSGHYFQKSSDLSDASVLFEFNSLNIRHSVAAFWKAGAGVFGIGTEQYTSSAPQRDVYAAWKAIWQGLNIERNLLEPEVVEVIEMENELLTERRLTQLKKQEKKIKENIEKEIVAEKKRNEEAFNRYTERERVKLEEIKRKDEYEQSRLKLELKKEVAARRQAENELEIKEKNRYQEPETKTQNEINANDKTNETDQTTLSIYDVETPIKEDSQESEQRNKEHLGVLSNELVSNQFLVRNLTTVIEGRESDKLAAIVQELNDRKSDVLLIESHLTDEENLVSNTLRSVRVAEKMKQYLVRKGISANRIMIKGVGSACDMDDQVILHQCDPNGLFNGTYTIVKEKLISSTSYDQYVNQNAKLKFKIMLGANPTSWDISTIEKYSNFSLEQFGARRTTFGMIGIFHDVAAANEALKTIIPGMVAVPKVVAYFDGIRLTNEQVELLKPIYPELENLTSF